MEKLSYLGDTIGDAVGTVGSFIKRIRCSKFRDLVSLLASRGLLLRAKSRLYSACVSSIVLYENEAWLVKGEDRIKLGMNDVRIVRWMSNARSGSRISAEKLRTRLKLNSMKEFLQDRRLQCLGLLERMEENPLSNTCRTFKVNDSLTRGRPRKTWNEVNRSDLKEREVSKDLAKAGTT